MIQLPLPMELATVPAPGSQGTKRSTTAAGYRWCLANNQQNPGAQNGSMNGLTNPLGVWDKGLSYISSSMKRWVNVKISNHDPARSLKTWHDWHAWGFCTFQCFTLQTCSPRVMFGHILFGVSEGVQTRRLCAAADDGWPFLSTVSTVVKAPEPSQHPAWQGVIPGWSEAHSPHGWISWFPVDSIAPNGPNVEGCCQICKITPKW